MKIKPYVEKLEKSTEYSDFKTKYPDAFLIAGFFVLDFEGGKSVHQIDFYVPSEKKIAAFTLDEDVKSQLLDMIGDKVPEKLDLETNIDLDALSGILADEMKNRGMSESIKKIIAIIQNIDGKKIWNLSCILSGMEILKSHIEDESKTVLKIEKTSVLDIMKKIPTNKIMKRPETSGEIKDELKKLDDIEFKIDEEKDKLKKELEKKGEKDGEDKTRKEES